MPVMDAVKKFLLNKAGNFALVGSAAIIPLVGAAGFAIDYTNMNRSASELQNANDAAALFAARYYEVNNKLPGQNTVNEFLQANYSGVVKDLKFYIKNDEIFVEAQSAFKPVIMNILTDDELKVDALSAAPLPKDVDLEIVLALDTTYSMTAEDKIGGLKVAATNFVNTMLDKASSRSRVTMGLVPFAQYVNVGLENRDKIWMDVPADQTINNGNVCSMKQDVLSKKNCRWEKRTRDGIPYDVEVCDYEYGEPYEVCGESTTTVKWNGCVGSRKFPTNLRDGQEDYDKTVEKFPGLMNEYCQSPVAPLTTDRGKLISQIKGLYATGETYVADGVMWGLRVLSPHAPFTEGKKPHEVRGELRKIMVLMTDGENQRSPELPKRPNHWARDKTKAKDWTKQACQQAKKAGVELFAITFGNSVPADSKKIMQKCATSSEHYFNASDSEKLDEVFSKIAGQLTRVRLTH